MMSRTEVETGRSFKRVGVFGFRLSPRVPVCERLESKRNIVVLLARELVNICH